MHSYDNWWAMIGIWRPAHQNESLLRIYVNLMPTFYKRVKTDEDDFEYILETI